MKAIRSKMACENITASTKYQPDDCSAGTMMYSSAVAPPGGLGKPPKSMKNTDRPTDDAARTHRGVSGMLNWTPTAMIA